LLNKLADMNQFTRFAIIIMLFACNTGGKTQKGSIERLDPALDAIVDNKATIEVIAEGFEWSEGPLWVEKEKMLLFSDVPTNTIYKWTEAKGKEKYLSPSGYTDTISRGGETGSNGLILDSAGRLVLCQHGNRQVARMDAALNNPKPVFVPIANEYNGKKLNSPNDAVINKKGELFFTDPPYGLEKNMDDPKKETPFQGVYKVTTSGNVILLVDSIARPNGIVLTPDESQLIIANSDGPKPFWYIYDIAGDSLTNGRIFYDPREAAKTERGAPDGLKIDSKGNVYATGPGGVWIFNKEAKVLGKIKYPEATSNVALSEDEKTLFITADNYVLRVRLRE
jgi:gluconolactonase